MTLINNEIPIQGFEIVRDAIYIILKQELENQKIIQGFDFPINLYMSRSNPFQHSEKVMINVSLDSSNYSNAHQKGVHSNTMFFIDVYTSAKETIDIGGGKSSSMLRDKFVGMIRYILQDHHYKSLALPNKAVMGTEVQSFNNFEPDTIDSTFIKMSRIAFNVRINETQSLWEGIDLKTIFTSVKIDSNNDEYQYITEIN